MGSTSETERGDPPTEAQYVDMVEWQDSEYAAVRITSDLLNAQFSNHDHDDLRMGVDVIQDGKNIALSAGTLEQSKAPHFYAYVGLTPEQARRVADGLYTAADNAEEAMKHHDTTQDEPDSGLRAFIRGLMS